MSDDVAATALVPKRGRLADAVIGALSSRIASGAYGPGAKLPSEQELCREFGVSRTVVREAVASLRLGGRLQSRQGLGVFVTGRDTAALAFDIEAADDIRSALQILELRLGVEVEAVALAAQRRSPAAIADLTAAFDRCAKADGTDVEQEAEADLAFHLAIARATGNPHFPNVLGVVGPHITTDLLIKHGRVGAPGHRTYGAKVTREHGAILAAIIQGSVKAARTAIRQHLEESMVRYRRLLEQAGTGGAQAKAPAPSLGSS